MAKSATLCWKYGATVTPFMVPQEGGGLCVSQMTDEAAVGKGNRMHLKHVNGWRKIQLEAVRYFQGRSSE